MLINFAHVRRQKYHIEVPGEDDHLHASLFQYSLQDTVEIKVHYILRNPREPPQQDIIPDSLHLDKAPPISCVVHAGYKHVLLGFLREIKFVTRDALGTSNAFIIFRAWYLIKVLDAFVAELLDLWKRQHTFHPTNMQPTPGPSFRSKVLNPLLQRQLRGIADHDLDAIRSSAGTSIEDIKSFYLEKDPLDPNLSTTYLRNILYSTPGHCSLALFSSTATDTELDNIATSTAILQQRRTTATDWIGSDLSDLEVSIIEAHGLQHLFPALTQDAVSRRFLLCNRALTTWSRMDILLIYWMNSKPLNWRGKGFKMMDGSWWMKPTPMGLLKILRLVFCPWKMRTRCSNIFNTQTSTLHAMEI
jgi:hypothetical protein